MSDYKKKVVGKYLSSVLSIGIVFSLLGGLVWSAINIDSEVKNASANSDFQFSFQHINIQGMGFATGIIQNPSNPSEIYVKTDVGGVYKLNDTQDSWNSITDHIYKRDAYKPIPNDDAVGSFAVDPNTPGTLYITLGGDRDDLEHSDPVKAQGFLESIGGSMWKSTDSGATWQELNVRRPDGYRIRINGNEKSNGINRIVGEGLMVDPNNSNILFFASAIDGLYRSLDAGNSWTRVHIVNDTLPNYDHDHFRSNIIIDPSSSNGTASQKIMGWVRNVGWVVSEDGGNTWSVKYSNTFNKASDKNAYTNDIDSQGNIYVSFEEPPSTLSDANFWKYTKATNTWSPIDPVSGTKGVKAVAIDPNDENHIFVSTDDQTWSTPAKFFESFNGGQTWTAKTLVEGPNKPDYWKATKFFNKNVSIPESYCDAHMIIDKASNGQTAWCSDGYGVSKIDLTYSNTQVLVDPVADNMEELIGMDVKIKPNGDALVSAWDMGGFIIRDPEVVPSNSDQFIDDTFGSLYSVEYARSNPDIVYLAGDKQGGTPGWAWKSTDGGVNFTEMLMPSQPNGIINARLAVSSNDPNTLIMSGLTAPRKQNTFKVFYSNDGGNSWRESTSQNDPAQFAVSYSGLGDTPGNFVSNPHKANTFYYYDCNNIPDQFGNKFTDVIWKSTDGGKTFEVSINNKYIWPANDHKYLGCGNKAKFRFQESNTEAIWVANTKSELNSDGSHKGMRLAYSDNDMTSLREVVGIDQLFGFTMGAPVPGNTAESAYVFGVINGDYGLFTSPDLVELVNNGGDGTGATWQKIANGDGLSEMSNMAGDFNEYGKVYMAVRGKGFYYTKAEPITSSSSSSSESSSISSSSSVSSIASSSVSSAESSSSSSISSIQSSSSVSSSSSSIAVSSSSSSVVSSIQSSSSSFNQSSSQSFRETLFFPAKFFSFSPSKLDPPKIGTEDIVIGIDPAQHNFENIVDCKIYAIPYTEPMPNILDEGDNVSNGWADITVDGGNSCSGLLPKEMQEEAVINWHISVRLTDQSGYNFGHDYDYFMKIGALAKVGMTATPIG